MLSRALEADPTSIILWIFYLLIYYSNMKSVGKDDMFSCAVCCYKILTLMILFYMEHEYQGQPPHAWVDTPL